MFIFFIVKMTYALEASFTEIQEQLAPLLPVLWLLDCFCSYLQRHGGGGGGACELFDLLQCKAKVSRDMIISSFYPRRNYKEFLSITK